MSPSPDISAIALIIADLARLNRKLVDRRLSGIGITRAQWRAIANLWRYGPLTQAALADVSEVKTATIARQIDRLEESGWVERLPDPNDRRANLVSMTGKAQGVMVEVAAIGQTLLKDMVIDLSPSELDDLISMLSTIKSRLVCLLDAPVPMRKSSV